MALWVLQVDAELDIVTLTYVEKDAPPKNCGRGGLAVLNDLESWVIDQAGPWDRLQMRGAVFVRQVAAFVQA